MCESSNFLLLMSYIKVCLHYQNACNPNNNGELWYTKTVSKF